MTDIKPTDEQRAREALADAFGCKATAAPARIRAGSKYVSIPVETAVRAMIAFASLPCKSGEGAGEIAASLTEQQRDAVLSARLHVSGGWRLHWKYAGEVMQGLTALGMLDADSSYLNALGLSVRLALTPDATQTREAELVEPDWAAIRAAVAKAAWPSTGLVDEAMTTIRAALNARGGA